MADHIKTFEAGADITCVASAAVTGGRLVKITGPERAVALTAAATDTAFGAAARDAKAGEDVLVLRGGVQPLVASAAIAAGARVVPAAGGKVATATEGGIGTALTTVTAADQPVQIALD